MVPTICTAWKQLIQILFIGVIHATDLIGLDISDLLSENDHYLQK